MCSSMHALKILGHLLFVSVIKFSIIIIMHQSKMILVSEVSVLKLSLNIIMDQLILVTEALSVAQKFNFFTCKYVVRHCTLQVDPQGIAKSISKFLIVAIIISICFVTLIDIRPVILTFILLSVIYLHVSKLAYLVSFSSLQLL